MKPCQSTPTVLREILPQVLRLADIATVQYHVAHDDTVRLQWRAPAHQNRGRVQSTQLQLLWRCGGPWRRKGDWVSNYNPEIWPHSWTLYIVFVGDLTCATTICVPMSSSPGYRREGTSRLMGEWVGAQVMIGENVTGWLVVIMSLKAIHSTLTTFTWLADRVAGQLRRQCYTWVFYYTQLSLFKANH